MATLLTKTVKTGAWTAVENERGKFDAAKKAKEEGK